MAASQDFVLVREDYEHAKPHPEPYLIAARLLGVLPTDCLAIEDSASGVASARVNSRTIFP